MNLNDKLKKNETLIESINEDIENLINEGISDFGIDDVVSIMRKGPVGWWLSKAKRKPIKSTTKAATDLLLDKEKELSDIKGMSKKEQREMTDDIKSLKKDIEDIKKSIDELNSMNARQEDGQLMNKIYIKFKDGEKYTLDLDKPSPEYLRNLEGKMYFNVSAHNIKSKYIDLRTTSLSKQNVFLRLHYKTLDINVKQKGKAKLVYQSGEKDKRTVSGKDVTVHFEIDKIE